MADDANIHDAPEAPLGWPLVDRRRQRDGSAPSGAERRVRPSPSRLEQFSAANDLLVALHEVAQTLPSSLDLDDVLDSAVDQVRALVGGDTVTVLLRDASDGSYIPVRGRGATVGAPVVQLPAAILPVLLHDGAFLVDDLGAAGGGIADEAMCGVYSVARTHESVIGVLAVESRSTGLFDEQSAGLLAALTEPFAVAIDNARLFRRIRTVAADEERRRLARDVHDRIGSSVALLGFELDRIIAEVSRGGDAEEPLRALRQQITGVVGEVRETLSDLRTEVSDERDLASTLRGFLDRLAARSGLEVDLDVHVSAALPRPQERELWHMALEALVNVERHSGADRVTVAWRCDDDGAELVISDDGKGLQSGGARADSYGLTGMRERAAAIGARIEVIGGRDMGTTVAIRMAHAMPATETGSTP